MTDMCSLQIGFMGFGEIGSSINNIYKLAKLKNLIVYDPWKGLNDSLSSCDLVNVSIPFFGLEKFVTAIKELKLKKDCILIIQSTIGVGTTNLIQSELPDIIVVHSPVRGVHPNLTEGILTFDKYLGVSDKYQDNEKIKNFLLEHYRQLRMKPVVCKSMESELAKVVSTTLYGVNIAAVNEVNALCEKYNVDFNTVYTKWQIGYNDGYVKLGKPNVVRPVLTATKKNEEGKQLIGGHCVVPNAVILKNMGHNHLADFILKYSDETNNKHVTGAKH